MKRLVIIVLALSLASFLGCTTAQKGAGIGAGAGAVLGGVIGNQSGHGVGGALIGAGAGGLAGALVGEQMDTMFCPVCGRHYTSSVKYCPVDGAELKPLQK